MDKEDVISMAREACDPDAVNAWPPYWTLTQDELERFAALVAQAEREACARVAEDWQDEIDNPRYQCDCATAIRARGNE